MHHLLLSGQDGFHLVAFVLLGIDRRSNHSQVGLLSWPRDLCTLQLYHDRAHVATDSWLLSNEGRSRALADLPTYLLACLPSFNCLVTCIRSR